MIMEEKKIYVMAPYRMMQRKIDFVFGGTPLFFSWQGINKVFTFDQFIKGKSLK